MTHHSPTTTTTTNHVNVLATPTGKKKNIYVLPGAGSTESVTRRTSAARATVRPAPKGWEGCPANELPRQGATTPSRSEGHAVEHRRRHAAHTFREFRLFAAVAVGSCQG